MKWRLKKPKNRRESTVSVYCLPPLSTDMLKKFADRLRDLATSVLGG